MTKIIFVMLFGLSLSGCLVINSAPKENFEFSQTAQTQDFKGIYRNIGDPKSIYLSQLILKDRIPSKPTDPLVKDEMGNLVTEKFMFNNLGKRITDRDIDFIEVLPTEKSLIINAIKDQCITYSKEYVIDSDFTLTDGKIILRKESYLLTRGGVGDVILGPSYEKVELGIDAKGNGKYKSQSYFAGIVFMLIPMAGGGADEVKFEKINNNVKFELCK